MMGRVEGEEYGSVSALWNVGFDAGAGLGPLVFGALFAISGFTIASVATAALVFATISVVLLDSKHAPDP
jgi:predicted MFS family arabinose efflux permease